MKIKQKDALRMKKEKTKVRSIRYEKIIIEKFFILCVDPEHIKKWTTR